MEDTPQTAEQQLGDKETVVRALVVVSWDQSAQYVALPKDSFLRAELERGYPADEILPDDRPDNPGLYYFEGVHWVDKTADTWQSPPEWDSGIRNPTWEEQAVPNLSAAPNTPTPSFKMSSTSSENSPPASEKAREQFLESKAEQIAFVLKNKFGWAVRVKMKCCPNSSCDVDKRWEAEIRYCPYCGTKLAFDTNNLEDMKAAVKEAFEGVEFAFFVGESV